MQVCTRSSRRRWRLTAGAYLAVAGLAACESAPTGVSGPPLAEPSAALARAARIDRSGYLPGAGGVQLFYRIVGHGPDTAIVLHGGPGLSMSYLADDIERLAAGRTLIFYDQRGGGFSPLPTANAATLAPSLFVTDLDAVRQFFGLQRVTLIGQSWGAMLAGLYATAHPDRVERLVMLDPGPVAASFDAAFQANLFARLTPEELARLGSLMGAVAQGPDPLGACEAASTLLFSHFQHDAESIRQMEGRWCGGTIEGIRQGRLVTQGTVIGALGAFDFRPLLAAALAGRQVPTLIVHGAADPIPLASSRAWAATIPGAELVVLADAGHFPWLEDAKTFFQVVDRFLKRTRTPPGHRG